MSNFIPSFSKPTANRQVLLVKRPNGVPLASDFEIKNAAVASPSDGQFLVRNLYLSADPVQRGWAANPDLTPLGAAFRALCVGIVTDSRAPEIKTGDIVYGYFGWQDYAIATRKDVLSHIKQPRTHVSAYAGVLGMPGITAWLALLDLAPPKAGDAVLVSTAAGAVGSVVGQVAKSRGAYVVGLTGSAEKVERCTSRFGYDVAFNYKTIDLAETLKSVRPDGFQIFFDNTGGPILDTALRAMARHGRIVQCGTAATSSWNPVPTGLRNEREVLMRALTWSGFGIFDHLARFDEAIEKLSDLLVAGNLQHDEDIDQGIDKAPRSLETVLGGDNTGKKLIFVGDA
ncbi:MAG: NADP-dependent oxidoreductase [Caulobacterales bacterium]